MKTKLEVVDSSRRVTASLLVASRELSTAPLIHLEEFDSLRTELQAAIPALHMLGDQEEAA